MGANQMTVNQRIRGFSGALPVCFILLKADRWVRMSIHQIWPKVFTISSLFLYWRDSKIRQWERLILTRMSEVFNIICLKWQFLEQERIMNSLKTHWEIMHKKLVRRKGLQKEQQNEVVKWNFLHTLHLNDLIRPIKCRSRISKLKSKYDYEEKKQLTTQLLCCNQRESDEFAILPKDLSSVHFQNNARCFAWNWNRPLVVT